MKQIIIGIIVAICLALGYSTGGLEKLKSTGSALIATIEKVSASEINPKAIETGGDFFQKGSIYSWRAIIFFSATVIGIVVFRQNTFD